MGSNNSTDPQAPIYVVILFPPRTDLTHPVARQETGHDSQQEGGPEPATEVREINWINTTMKLLFSTLHIYRSKKSYLVVTVKMTVIVMIVSSISGLISTINVSLINRTQRKRLVKQCIPVILMNFMTIFVPFNLVKYDVNLFPA